VHPPHFEEEDDDAANKCSAVADMTWAEKYGASFGDRKRSDLWPNGRGSPVSADPKNRAAANTRVLEYYSSSEVLEYFLLLEYSLVSISGCKFPFTVAFYAVN